MEVVFLNHDLGRAPEDDLLLQVQGMVAEYERAKILERSRRGKRHAAQRGSVNVLSGAPYGYRYISRHEGGGEASLPGRPGQARWCGRSSPGWARNAARSARSAAGCNSKASALAREKGLGSQQGLGHAQEPGLPGAAAFGKTRVRERRPRLRPLRGAARAPRGATPA